MGVANRCICAILALLSCAEAEIGSPQASPGSELWNRSAQLRRKVPRSSGTLANDSTLPPPYLHLPMFLHSRVPLVEKERFAPAGGSGLEQIPRPLREILIPARQSISTPTVSTDSVRTWCKMNKMRVEVPRSVVGAGESTSQLKLGTCEASKSTKDHIYFENDLSLCGTKRTVSFNSVLFCF